MFISFTSVSSSTYPATENLLYSTGIGPLHSLTYTYIAFNLSAATPVSFYTDNAHAAFVVITVIDRVYLLSSPESHDVTLSTSVTLSIRFTTTPAQIAQTAIINPFVIFPIFFFSTSCNIDMNTSPNSFIYFTTDPAIPPDWNGMWSPATFTSNTLSGICMSITATLGSGTANTYSFACTQENGDALTALLPIASTSQCAEFGNVNNNLAVTVLISSVPYTRPTIPTSLLLSTSCTEPIVYYNATIFATPADEFAYSQVDPVSRWQLILSPSGTYAAGPLNGHQTTTNIPLQRDVCVQAATALLAFTRTSNAYGFPEILSPLAPPPLPPNTVVTATITSPPELAGTYTATCGSPIATTSPPALLHVYDGTWAFVGDNYSPVPDPTLDYALYGTTYSPVNLLLNTITAVYKDDQASFDANLFVDISTYFSAYAIHANTPDFTNYTAMYALVAATVPEDELVFFDAIQTTSSLTCPAASGTPTYYAAPANTATATTLPTFSFDCNTQTVSLVYTTYQPIFFYESAFTVENSNMATSDFSVQLGGFLVGTQLKKGYFGVWQYTDSQEDMSFNTPVGIFVTTSYTTNVSASSLPTTATSVVPTFITTSFMEYTSFSNSNFNVDLARRSFDATYDPPQATSTNCDPADTPPSGDYNYFMTTDLGTVVTEFTVNMAPLPPPAPAPHPSYTVL